MSIPKIQIGDYVLTEAQAEAVRMAVANTEAEVGNAGMRVLLGPQPLTERLREVMSIFYHASESV